MTAQIQGFFKTCNESDIIKASFGDPDGLVLRAEGGLKILQTFAMLAALYIGGETLKRVHFYTSAVRLGLLSSFVANDLLSLGAGDLVNARDKKSACGLLNLICDATTTLYFLDQTVGLLPLGRLSAHNISILSTTWIASAGLALFITPRDEFDEVNEPAYRKNISSFVYALTHVGEPFGTFHPMGQAVVGLYTGMTSVYPKWR